MLILLVRTKITIKVTFLMKFGLFVGAFFMNMGSTLYNWELIVFLHSFLTKHKGKKGSKKE
ncbi:hypothetical protein MTsPCn5_36060 [Croceitalea sp. MTPC5]|nr:hypothetical protein MTsPCn5_36060 [Croceitalea sp. MTPC5]